MLSGQGRRWRIRAEELMNSVRVNQAQQDAAVARAFAWHLEQERFVACGAGAAQALEVDPPNSADKTSLRSHFWKTGGSKLSIWRFRSTDSSKCLNRRGLSEDLRRSGASKTLRNHSLQRARLGEGTRIFRFFSYKTIL